jgi:hypothetical protein
MRLPSESVQMPAQVVMSAPVGTARVESSGFSASQVTSPPVGILEASFGGASDPEITVAPKIAPAGSNVPSGSGDDDV